MLLRLFIIELEKLCYFLLPCGKICKKKLESLGNVG